MAAFLNLFPCELAVCYKGMNCAPGSNVCASRPMGDLQFLRIWHDNSGLGPNGSWYLSFIVFRDVQTGKKYEFIVNDWLAVEYGDGQVGGWASCSQLLTVPPCLEWRDCGMSSSLRITFAVS